MPDDRGQTDKLHRKIDRIVAGQPSPVLDDDDGEELALLAGRLRNELPHDMPDPGFREELKKELTDPGPRLVRFRPSPTRRTYPIVMFAGALAAVVVMTVAVSMMVYRSQANTTGTADADEALAGAVPTVAGTAVVAMANSSSREAAGSTPARAAPAVPTDNTWTPTAVNATPTAESVAPMAETGDGMQADLASAGLPPLDDSHVELGALATVTAQREPVPDNVAFSLATELPDLDDTAPVYHLSAPHVDPNVLLRGIAQTLEIDASVNEETVQGRSVYTLKSESGVTFSWMPASGAFACDVPGSISVDEQEDIAQEALEWLDNLGYPVDGQSLSPVVESSTSDGEWNVKIPLGDIPDPAVGHPLSVSLIVNQDGRIIRATGYWLKLSRFRELQLMSAENAWQALLDGRGYWPAGAVPDTPGEFRVESFAIRYILTISEKQDVILQPVVSASGTFYDRHGNPAGETTVFVQAAQLTSS